VDNVYDTPCALLAQARVWVHVVVADTVSRPRLMVPTNLHNATGVIMLPVECALHWRVDC